MLETLNEITLLVDEPLKNVTFTKTGGPADVLALPKTKKEVEEIVAYCREQGLSWLVLGNASNLIVRDGGIRDVVIMLTEMKEIKVAGTTMIVDAGAKLIDTTYEALAADLTGFEFACGIPGSVGGAVYMNAGAYGGEIKDCIDYALCVNEHGDLIQLTKEQLHLDYRNSVVQKQHLVVLEAAFTLEPGNLNEIQAKMDDLTERRESKQPLEYPSCGSVFQRPPGHFAGKLIQDSNLQGHRIGGVEVSTKHAGFMVNVDNGTATDYENLIHYVQKVVKEKFDVELHREVRIIGEYPKSE